VLKEDLVRMRDASDQYYADKGPYPSTLDALVRLRTDDSRRSLHQDSTAWQTIPAGPDLNNPTAEAGVYDVKSRSDATAIDGSKYADW
jgi:general secretion pathway protein G